MTTTKATFPGKNGHDVAGELAEPAGTVKAGAIVLVQEWWGVNDHIRSLASRAAEAGFLVAVPDLYHGKSTKDPAEAQKLMTDLDTVHAVGDIGAAVSFLKAHPRSNGKVAVMGFCMGGALSFASACHLEGLAAIVSFYGVPPADKVDYTRVTANVMAHVAKKDQWVTVEKVEDIKRQLDAQKKPMQLHIYDADHAFVNDTRPEVYSPENAKLAWTRSMDFLRENLT